MTSTRLHPGTFVAGVVFTLFGGALLLDALEVVRVDLAVLWPLTLVGIGLAIIATVVIDRGGD